MTPFHVLLFAACCRPHLLQVLLDADQAPEILGWKDKSGRTAVQYLMEHGIHPTTSQESSSRHNMLRMALERWMVDSLSSWKGALESLKWDLSDRVNAIVGANEVAPRQSLLDEAILVLSHYRYQRIECTSLLDLSLWKIEMQQMEQASSSSTTETVSTAIHEDGWGD